jgi:putative ABC transport system permease protein
MFRLALSNALSRASRLVVSVLAVALGVAFITATLAVTDALKGAVEDAFGRESRDLSATVDRSPQATEAGSRTVPLELLEKVRAVPGVAAAEGELWGPITGVTGGEGRPLFQGERTVLLGLATEPKLSGFTLVEGRLPARAHDVVLDRRAAQLTGMALGQQVFLPAPSEAGRPEPYTVSGIVELGARYDRLSDAAVIGLPTSSAAKALGAAAYGRIDVLAESGVPSEAVARSLSGTLGASYRVRTGEEVRQADLAEAAADVDSFANALLAFAAIAVVVSGFAMHNTFGVLVAQKLRDNALLRCVGATRRQVGLIVLAESLVVSLVAALLGLALGMGLAALLLRTGFADIGVRGGEQTSLGLAPRVVVLAMATGIVVTLLSVLMPMRQAARTSPLAAMRLADPLVREARRRRLVSAGCLGLVGIAALSYATVANSAGLAPTAAGVGAFATLLATLMAGPLFVPRLIEFVARSGGTLGRLAGENARRNPHRTATTTAALTIGMALVTVVGTVTGAMSDSLERQYTRSQPFAYTLRTSTPAHAVPDEVTTALAAGDAIAGTVRVRPGGITTEAEVNGRTVRVSGVGSSVRDLAPRADQGTLADLRPGTVAVNQGLAQKLHVRVGDAVTARMTRSGIERNLRVVALLDDMSPLGPFTILDDDFAQLVPDAASSGFLLVSAKQGASAAEVRQAVERATQGHETVIATSAQNGLREQSKDVDDLRQLLWGLLALSLLIAMFNLANTLSLQVMERTGESAVLRALGLTRGQLRLMLAAEGLLMSVVGAVVGLIVGLVAATGIAAVVTTPEDTVIALPSAAQLAGSTLLAVAIGVLATVLPARSAVRQPVAVALSRN